MFLRFSDEIEILIRAKRIMAMKTSFDIENLIGKLALSCGQNDPRLIYTYIYKMLR